MDGTAKLPQEQKLSSSSEGLCHWELLPTVLFRLHFRELRLVVLDCRCVYHLATISALVWWKAGGTPEVSEPKPNPNVVHVIL